MVATDDLGDNVIDPRERRPLGRTGFHPTALGFGGSRVGMLYAKVPEATAIAALRRGYDLGIRYFDTAPLYGDGLGERRLAHALAGRDRDDVVLSTKVGQRLASDDSGEARPGYRSARDYRRDSVLRSIDESLERLGVERLDVVLIHDLPRPGARSASDASSFEIAMRDALPTLRELRDTSVVGAVGVGVNDCRVVAACLAQADLDVVLLAGGYTLLDHAALGTIFPECSRRGIGVIVGAPFNSGILARGADSGATYFDSPPPTDILDKTRRIERICTRHGVPLAAAALRFPLAHPAVASVLPGIGSAARAQEIFRLFDHPIPPTLWSELKRAGLLPDAAPTPA